MTQYQTATDFRYSLAGLPPEKAEQILVWGHGWGQNGASFRTLTESLNSYAHVLLDFPGFGDSPRPPVSWGTRDYADVTAELIRNLFPGKKVFWIGHSFGTRVGIQLGAHYPELFEGLVFIAGAGLPRKRTLWQQIKLKWRILSYKAMKKLAQTFSPATFEKYRNNFGSADYRNAGELRPVFVRVVNEDLTDIAKQVACPTLLVYGSQDTETPPEIGERLSRLIPNSALIIIPGKDHYSVLSEGRHLVTKYLSQFISRSRS